MKFEKIGLSFFRKFYFIDSTIFFTTPFYEKTITDNAMTYQSYRTLIDTFYEEGKTTGNYTDEAMLNYTKYRHKIMCRYLN